MTGLAQLGVRDDELMPQATPQVPASPQRMIPRVRARYEDASKSETTNGGTFSKIYADGRNGDEITPNARNNNVDATKKDSGDDRMMSALQRLRRTSVSEDPPIILLVTS